MYSKLRFGLLALVAAIGVATAPYLLSAREGNDDVIEETFAVATAAAVNATAAAQENVVVSPTDKPLDRKAKLDRNWVLYNDGTTVWALYKGTATGTCISTPTSRCPAGNAVAVTRRAVQTMSFFAAFKANFRIVLISPDRLAIFSAGEPITSTEGLTADMFIKHPYFTYRLVKRADSPAVYLDDGTMLRPIVHEKVFKNLGLDFKDVETVPATEISAKPIEAAVTAETVFIEPVEVQTTAARKTVEAVKSRLGSKMLEQVRSAIIKAADSSDYFLLTKQGKRAIPATQEHQLSQRLGLDLSRAVEVTAEEAAAIPTAAAVTGATTQVEVNASAQ